MPLVSPIRLHQKRRLTSAIMSQEEDQPPLNLPKIKEVFLVGSTGGSGGFSFWKSKNLLPKLKKPEVAKRRKKSSGLSRKSDPAQEETVVEDENKTDNLGTALEARREALTRPGFFFVVWRRAKLVIGYYKNFKFWPLS